MGSEAHKPKHGPLFLLSSTPVTGLFFLSYFLQKPHFLEHPNSHSCSLSSKNNPCHHFDFLSQTQPQVTYLKSPRLKDLEDLIACTIGTSLSDLPLEPRVLNFETLNPGEILELNLVGVNMELVCVEN